MIRNFFLGVLAVVVILVIWQWQLVSYAAEQGFGQAEIIWAAKPVEKILKDPDFPDSLKEKLRLIAEIRKFAVDSLGLTDTENYQTVYDQKGQEIMWVVMACEPFELRAKLWKFPVVGSVPYKGFFDRDKAKAEAKKWEEKGYDVSVRNPGGWSTLGWFTDPILSSMLNRSDGDLASLIIHEMVHATLWVKDSVDFNENLATFIGDTAAYEFLKYKTGKDSKEYKLYVAEDENYNRYSEHMLRGAKALEDFYHTLKPTESMAEKKKKKEEFIQRIVDSIDTLDLQLQKPPSKRFKSKLPNNTYFMSFRHYESKLETFKQEMAEKFPGNLRGYLRYLAQKFPK
jgi:predicted aminopeptidase